MLSKLKIFVLIFSISAFFLQGCKEDEVLGDDPYGGAKKLIGVKLFPVKPPVPAAGLPGDIVTVQVANLDTLSVPYQILFNGQLAEVVEAPTAANPGTIKVKVPDNSSSGAISMQIGNQVIFGPRFEVLGKVYLDASFKAKKGTDQFVSQVYSFNGDLMVIGNFTDWDNKGLVKKINRIVRVSNEGSINKLFNSGPGSPGPLSSLAFTPNRIYAAGNFGGFGDKNRFMHNIARIYHSGAIDTTTTTTYEGKTLGIPSFKGGSDAPVDYMALYNNKLTIVGDGIKAYLSRRYNVGSSSGKDDLEVIDSINVDQLFRTDLDGNLDKTYRFNPTIGQKKDGVPRGEGIETTNGIIFTAYQHETGALAGKLLIGGGFTKFEDKPAGSIIRLNEDGSIDGTFNPGTGADFITSINYNEVTGKYLVAGRFLTFNGKKASGLVVLNPDGSIDETFTGQDLNIGGDVFFARQLNDGLIIAAGQFSSYGGVSRQGMMILDNKGKLASGYNNFGGIQGRISDVKEAQTAEGKRALLIFGFIRQFNGDPVNNIFRITFE